MPTYEYECKSCGHTFDAFQSMKDEPLKICPECGKGIRRLINGGTGVIFKGTGFYVTDKGGKAGKSDEGKKAGEGGKDGQGQKSGASSASPAKTDAPCAGCARSETCPKTAS